MLRYGAGSIAATIQSIVYGGATTGIFSLLQSAGATIVLPSIGTIVTGVAVTGVGVAVAVDDHLGPSRDELLHNAAESVTQGDDPDDDDDGTENPPPHHTTVPEEYLLTPQAFLAIVKSWVVEAYNPPETDRERWLGKIHSFCERYGVPASQRALCAMHHMRADCKQAARDAKCYDMTWDAFTVWLRWYDRKLRFPGFVIAFLFLALVLRWLFFT